MSNAPTKIYKVPFTYADGDCTTFTFNVKDSVFHPDKTVRISNNDCSVNVPMPALLQFIEALSTGEDE